MKIRAFCESDYSKILEIYSKSKLDELRFETKKFEFLPLEKDQQRLLEFKESDIYVYEDGSICGYAALYGAKSKYGAEIRALFVHPDYRGKGIGKSLLEFVLSKITGKSSLYVAASNVQTKQLYSKYGFKVVDEFETTYNGQKVFANKILLPAG